MENFSWLAQNTMSEIKMRLKKNKGKKGNMEKVLRPSGWVGVSGNVRGPIDEQEIQQMMPWDALLASLANGQIPEVSHSRNL